MPGLQSHYQEKTVLITGHTGYKGSWLTVWLRQLGADVIGYALAPPTEPNLFTAAGLQTHITHYDGDVRDTDRLTDVIRQHRPAFIFHLAAQALVLTGYEQPRETFDVNVMGTVSVLEAVRQAGAPCSIVLVATDRVYENRAWSFGYREIDRLGGYDPYSASKAAMEIAANAYRRSFFPVARRADHGVRLATTRAGNVLGGGDWAANRIVPDMVRALAAEKSIFVRNPGHIRPWQHVLVPLSGYLWLAACLAADDQGQLPGSWNFGPPAAEAFTVRDLVEAMIAAWGSGNWHTEAQADAPHESGRLRLTIDQAQTLLGWQPAWDFQQTVAHTAGWYRQWLAAPDDPAVVYAATEADIAAFVAAGRDQKQVWAVE